jgi:hypothetical protein
MFAAPRVSWSHSYRQEIERSQQGSSLHQDYGWSEKDLEASQHSVAVEIPLKGLKKAWMMVTRATSQAVIIHQTNTVLDLRSHPINQGHSGGRMRRRALKTVLSIAAVFATYPALRWFGSCRLWRRSSCCSANSTARQCEYWPKPG